ATDGLPALAKPLANAQASAAAAMIFIEISRKFRSYIDLTSLRDAAPRSRQPHAPARLTGLLVRDAGCTGPDRRERDDAPARRFGVGALARREQRGDAAAAQLREGEATHLVGERGVETAKGLVEQQHAGLRRERTHQ